jgi:hypothetical protein
MGVGAEILEDLSNIEKNFMEKIRKIKIKVRNSELDALEDLLFSELSESERKKLTKKCLKLFGRLVEKFDKSS